MRIALFVTKEEQRDQRQANPMTDGRAVQMATTRLMIMIQMLMMMIIEIITIKIKIKELCK